MPEHVPADWMPAAAMKRIHVHWTAGTHTASAYERTRYHILVQGDGSLRRGDVPINANAAGSGLAQASHTKNANTGAVGVSLCCMAGARDLPFDAGRYPMTRLQWDSMLRVVAELSLRYGIAVTPQTILTHAEVQPILGIAQSGKWDITRLAFALDVVGHQAVGNLMRVGVAAERDRLRGEEGPPTPPPAEMRLPRFRVHGVAPSTLNFRDAPNGNKKGALPEGAQVERLAVWQNWSQVRTAGGYVGWVASAYLRAVGG